MLKKIYFIVDKRIRIGYSRVVFGTSSPLYQFFNMESKMQKIQSLKNQIESELNELLTHNESNFKKKYTKLRQATREGFAGCISFMATLAIHQYNITEWDSRDVTVSEDLKWDESLHEAASIVSKYIKEQAESEGIDWKRERGQLLRMSQASKKYIESKKESLYNLTHYESTLELIKKEGVTMTGVLSKKTASEEKNEDKKINVPSEQPTPRVESEPEEPMDLNQADSGELLDLITNAIKILDGKNCICFLNSRLATLGYNLIGITGEKKAKLIKAA